MALSCDIKEQIFTFQGKDYNYNECRALMYDGVLEQALKAPVAATKAAERAEPKGPAAPKGAVDASDVDAMQGLMERHEGINANKVSKPQLIGRVVNGIRWLTNNKLGYDANTGKGNRIFVAESKAEYERITKDAAGKAKTGGGVAIPRYDADGNYMGADIYINLDTKSLGTVAHELAHVALMEKFAGDPNLFKKFVAAIKPFTSASDLAYLDKFIRQYADEDARPEEFLAEMTAKIEERFASGEVDAKELSALRKLAEAIKQFINKLTGGLVFPLEKESDVRAFFNALGQSIAVGGVMKEGLAEAAAKEVDEAFSKQIASETNRPVELRERIEDSAFGPKIKYKKGGYALSLVKESDFIDIKALVKKIADEGGRVWFWTADQLGRGMYSDNTLLGKHYLDAGPSFALDPKNRKNNVIWASGAKTQDLNGYIGKSDYVFIISGSPQKSKLFNKAVTKVLKERAEKATGLSWDDFTKKLIELDSQKEDGRPKKATVISSILEKYKSFDEFLQSGDRKDFFLQLEEAMGKTTTALAKYLKDKNYSLDVNALRDGFYAENEFGANDVMMVLKATGLDETQRHGTYNKSIIGEVIGVPDRRVNAVSLLPEEQQAKLAKHKKGGTPIGGPGGITVRTLGTPLFETAETKPRREAMERKEEEAPRGKTASIAPFYRLRIRDMADAERVAKTPAYKNFESTLNDLADAMGVKIDRIKPGVGKWGGIMELSAKVQFAPGQKFAKIREYAAIMGALAPESQDTTIAGEYVKEGDKRATGYAIRIPTNDVDAAIALAESSGLYGLDIDTENGEAIIFASNGKEVKQARLLAKQFRLQGIGTGKFTAEPLITEFIGEAQRADILRNVSRRLRGEGGRQQGGARLRNLLKLAQERDAAFQRLKGYEPTREKYAKLRNLQIELLEKGQDLSALDKKRLESNRRRLTPAIEQQFGSWQDAYQEAKDEIAKVGDRIVEAFGGYNIPFNIKNIGRATIKTLDWYMGHPTLLGDGARTTIIVDDIAKADEVFDRIKEEYYSPREENYTTDLGYPKRLLEVLTANGRLAEFQVMTPEAYLAKDGVELFPEAKRAEITKRLNKIQSIIGASVPDGMGHLFYELQRDPKVSSSLRDATKEPSNLYYKAFMDPESMKGKGDELMKSIASFMDKFKAEKANEGTWAAKHWTKNQKLVDKFNEAYSEPSRPRREAMERKEDGETQESIRAGAAKVAAMSREERDNYDPRADKNYNGYNLYEATKLVPKPTEKPKRVTDNNSLSLWTDWHSVINIDGVVYGLTKYEDPDAISDEEDSAGFPKEYVWAYARMDQPGSIRSTVTNDIAELVSEIKSLATYDPKRREIMERKEDEAFNGIEEPKTPIGDTKTVMVDGKERTVFNSEGNSIHPTVEGVRNFWRFYKGPKDKEGRPIKVYHATHADIDAFRKTRGAHLGFHFGDIDAAKSRLEMTTKDRLSEADKEEFNRLTNKYREAQGRVRDLEEEFRGKRKQPTDEENAVILERIKSGENIGDVLGEYDYVPTKEELNLLSQLKKAAKEADPDIYAFALGANIGAYYISTGKLLRLPDVGNWGSVKKIKAELPWESSATTMAELADDIASNGYGGIVYLNAVEYAASPQDSYIVFDSNKIKSATGNYGRFDPRRREVMERKEDELPPDTPEENRRVITVAKRRLDKIEGDEKRATERDVLMGDPGNYVQEGDYRTAIDQARNFVAELYFKYANLSPVDFSKAVYEEVKGISNEVSKVVAYGELQASLDMYAESKKLSSKDRKEIQRISAKMVSDMAQQARRKGQANAALALVYNNYGKFASLVQAEKINQEFTAKLNSTEGSEEGKTIADNIEEARDEIKETLEQNKEIAEVVDLAEEINDALEDGHAAKVAAGKSTPLDAPAPVTAEQLVNSPASYDKIISDLEAEVKRLDGLLAQVNKLYSSAAADAASYAQQVADLNREINRKNKLIDRLKDKKNEIAKERDKYKNQVDVLKQKIADLKDINKLLAQKRVGKDRLSPSKIEKLRQQLLDLALAGKLNDPDFDSVFAAITGGNFLTTQDRKAIEHMANALKYFESVGSKEMAQKYVKRLNDYLEQQSKSPWTAAKVAILLQSWFYNNVLSSIGTFFNAFAGSVLVSIPNATVTSINIALKDPKSGLGATLYGMLRMLKELPTAISKGAMNQRAYDSMGTSWTVDSVSRYADPFEVHVLNGFFTHWNKIKNNPSLAEKSKASIALLGSIVAQATRITALLKFIDPVLRHSIAAHMEGMQDYIKIKGEMRMRKTEPGIAEAWTPYFSLKLIKKIDEMAGVARADRSVAAFTALRDVATMKSRGIPVPLDYARRRTSEIMREKRDAEQTLTTDKMAADMIMMWKPDGVLGYAWDKLGKKTAISEKDNFIKAFTKLALNLSVLPFLRISAQGVSEIQSTIPVIGGIAAAYGVAKNKDGEWYVGKKFRDFKAFGIEVKGTNVQDSEFEMQRMQRRIALNILSSFVIAGLFAEVFDVEDAEDDDEEAMNVFGMRKKITLDPNRKIDFTSDARGPKSANQGIMEGRANFSMRIRAGSNEEWSDWMSVRLAPHMTIPVAWLGRLSDDANRLYQKPAFGSGATPKRAALNEYFTSVPLSALGEVSFQTLPRFFSGLKYDAGAAAARMFMSPVAAIAQPSIYRDVVSTAASMADATRKGEYMPEGFIGTSKAMFSSLYGLNYSISPEVTDEYGLPIKAIDPIRSWWKNYTDIEKRSDDHPEVNLRWKYGNTFIEATPRSQRIENVPRRAKPGQEGVYSKNVELTKDQQELSSKLTKALLRNSVLSNYENIIKKADAARKDKYEMPGEIVADEINKRHRKTVEVATNVFAEIVAGKMSERDVINKINQLNDKSDKLSELIKGGKPLPKVQDEVQLYIGKESVRVVD